MDQFRKLSGAALVALGVLVLIFLAANLSQYIENFPSNPIHRYIVGDDSDTLIKIGDTPLSIPDSVFHIAALMLGLWFLKLWIELGAILIKTGRVLVVDDTERIEQLVEKLVDRASRE